MLELSYFSSACILTRCGEIMYRLAEYPMKLVLLNEQLFPNHVLLFSAGGI